jgi:serralysin
MMTCVGGSGNDRLDGGEGDDRMDGGWGNDKIVVGPGNDIATGGWGRDTFIFAEGIGEAVITDFGRWDKIKFDGVELASIEIDGDDVTLGLSDGGSVLLEDADFGWRLPNWFDEDLIA